MFLSECLHFITSYEAPRAPSEICSTVCNHTNPPTHPHEVMHKNCRMSKVVGISSLPLESRIPLLALTQAQAYL